MPTYDDWPNDDDLRQYIREAGEHRRSWALVGGLSRKLMAVHRPPSHRSEPRGERPGNYTEKVQALEARIVRQKAQIRNLEEARVFEKQSEGLLIEALEDVRITDGRGARETMHTRAAGALAEHHARLSRPRPETSG